ncbi:DUF159-domain-containing protein [Gloeophyllum trabeum ATCC 11539]|uniref:DUF159-domain-containing protein n=1 Tax=Gloeophyllum trabeum (strain ATCC 11539 / FP-39264 / Madison 617) TaxID=670483 RepID=S7RS34_GLOTA|nr:DUF159-domain-containing protein [Gloeophyllum trabeum ATCC 11539]EPQ55834.1 DUF159-domain-containing protein [Gloeophyllum trabeum ATCC 11539]
MCGRFALALPHHEIQQLPGYPNVQVGGWIDQDQFHPRYNIAPRSRAPVIRRNFDGPFEECAAGPRYVLQTMKWGLVPHWSKHEDKTLSTTNARAENLVEGGSMWGPIKGKKRCAVICQGYYEWLKKGKDKLPHFTRFKDGRIMLLAGLWDCATLEGEKEPLYTFTIVTTDANKEFNWLHDRQPVILSSREALETWLDTSGQTWTPALTKLVKPFSDEAAPLECYQVPKEVGKIGTESPSFIQPVSQRKDGIESMFAKQKESAKKRKRGASSLASLPSSSQSIMAGIGAEVKQESDVPTSSGKKMNTWEDDELEYTDEAETKPFKQDSTKDEQDVICIDSDNEELKPQTQRPKTEAQSPKTPSKRPKTHQTKPRKTPEAKKPQGTKDISTFFKKV